MGGMADQVNPDKKTLEKLKLKLLGGSEPIKARGLNYVRDDDAYLVTLRDRSGTHPPALSGDAGVKRRRPDPARPAESESPDRALPASLEAEKAVLGADLEALVAHKGQLLGIDTGFPSLNDLTQGWQPGDLVIIAARPSIGKTAMALNVAVAAARQGHHVAIFSLEMRRQQLERRMLSTLARVPLTKIQTGYLSDSDYDGLSSALVELGDLPVSVMDQTGITVQEIRTACRRQRSEKGLRLVIVDYIQLVRGSLDRRGATRNEELGDVSQRLKWMAGELALPVIVLSQLRRTGPVRPSLEALRDSGALEQDADVVCFLHRKDHKASGITAAIVEKQRNGPTGTVNLSLDRDIQLFTDAGEQTAEDARTADAEEQQDAKTRAIIRARAKGR